ncbi:MAG: head decoration protein [Anaerovoracaceae bacterium]
MAKALNAEVATFEYDGLIVDSNPIADVFAVTVATGMGKLKRGTVLSRSTKDGKMSITGTSAGSGDTLTANCILAEDVDATSEANALAYRTGHFATNKLIVKEEYTLTAADKEALRDAGILLSDAMEY